MKTPGDLSEELEQLIKSHYYSEDFELVSSVRQFCSELNERERIHMEQVVLSRLMDEGSLVDVILCSVVIVPSAKPVLVDILNRQTETNQNTRALIRALRHYGGDDAYRAVERFLDSDQEREAVEILAAIDFVRTLPLFFRLIRRDQHNDALLQILYDRSKTVGLENMIGELTASSASRFAEVQACMHALLHYKKPPYNPFSPDEISRIIRGVGRT